MKRFIHLHKDKVESGNVIQVNRMGTFSLVARCRETSALGVCVSTAVPAVGSVVPHAEANVGAIATQGYTNVLYGIEGLKLLKAGFSPKAALDTMLGRDKDRELRQVAVINHLGEKAVFTGKATVEWTGDLIREDCVAAGNMLSSSDVLKAMVEAFETSKRWLAERLISSLEAGDAAGGDKRGKVSAALLVVGDENMVQTRPFLSLRVDFHDEPVRELRRVFEAYKK